MKGAQFEAECARYKVQKSSTLQHDQKVRFYKNGVLMQVSNFSPELLHAYRTTRTLNFAVNTYCTHQVFLDLASFGTPYFSSVHSLLAPIRSTSETIKLIFALCFFALFNRRSVPSVSLNIYFTIFAGNSHQGSFLRFPAGPYNEN